MKYFFLLVYYFLTTSGDLILEANAKYYFLISKKLLHTLHLHTQIILSLL